MHARPESTSRTSSPIRLRDWPDRSGERGTTREQDRKTPPRAIPRAVIPRARASSGADRRKPSPRCVVAGRPRPVLRRRFRRCERPAPPNNAAENTLLRQSQGFAGEVELSHAPWPLTPRASAQTASVPPIVGVDVTELRSSFFDSFAGTTNPDARGMCKVTQAASISSPPDRKQRAPELDEVTITRAQRGDLRARRLLVDRYQRPVLALVSRLLRGSADPALVEDIAQETFLRVFRALPKFDRSGPARLSTWILTIASHRTIDELRKRRIETRPFDPSSFEVPANDRADLEAERRMLARLLGDAIEALSPEYRAAFVLREYHGLEYTEIASALSIDLGTVKSRLNRARSRLRRALQEVYHA